MANHGNGWLDQKIISSFRLFEGQRSDEEDRKIFDVVSQIAAEEVLMFADEALTRTQKSRLNFSDHRALSKYIFTIPYAAFRLKRRLNSLIDNLLIRTLKSKQKHG